MDHHQENEFSSGTTVKVLSGNLRKNGSHENWEVAAEWATEDDYRMFNNEPYADSNSSYEARSSQYLSGISEPPSKRSRLSQSADPTASNRSKAIGKMFYKTKLCCKFRIGTCPYITNCNFAHSIEELRNPPPNWQEIVVGAHDDEPREEYQIPSLGVSDERSYKGRHCKKFYTEEGCPYGEACTFLHDEQSRDRESVVISLGPSSGGNNASQPVVKASNWKTRICNKWDLTGYCPFGSKCHFAHGATELYPYGGGPIDSDVNDSSMPNGKQGDLPAKTSMDPGFGSHAFVPHTDGYHKGYPSQRFSSKALTSGQRSMQKWKGPDKISKIYGDWIDDL